MSTIPPTIGPYRIERELARGGMGIVYLAHDTRLNRAAAIKALPDDVASNPDRLARFKQEAQLLASLSHPNIAAIYGLEESSGRRYLALKHVEGETLAKRIARGPIPIDEAVTICLQIAAGIEAAHEGGIIHRDLKPGNVMITPNDVVKVLDFGLAKGTVATDPSQVSESSPTVTASPTTMPGVVLGTARYLSPEQARGKAVDRRTDIWSFGCVLFECLTGKVVFDGETVSDTIAKILVGEVDWSRLPKNTPARMRELLKRCLPLPELPDGAPAEIVHERWRRRESAPQTEPAEPPIVVPETLHTPHKLVSETSRVFRGVRSSTDRHLDISVSKESRGRALRIMNALIRALEKRGLQVEVTRSLTWQERERLQRSGEELFDNATRVLVDGEWIRFGITEKSSVVHTPAPEPPKYLRGGERDSWLSRNDKPLRELRPNGVLELSIVTFVTTKPGPLTVRLFDTAGRWRADLIKEALAQPGYHEATVDSRSALGETLPSGIYFYRVESAEGTATGRIALVKGN